MSFRSQSTVGAFHRSLLGASYRNAAKVSENRGLKHDLAVSLFLNVDCKATKVGAVTLCGRASDATGTLERQTHDHSLARDNGHAFMAICTAVIVKVMKSHAYPCTFHTRGEVQYTLMGVYSAGVYV